MPTRSAWSEGIAEASRTHLPLMQRKFWMPGLRITAPGDSLQPLNGVILMTYALVSARCGRNGDAV